MELIRSGFVLCKPYMNLEMKKDNILQKCRKVWKTLTNISMFYKLALQLSKIHVDYSNRYNSWGDGCLCDSP
jgi:hypothetical protein